MVFAVLERLFLSMGSAVMYFVLFAVASGLATFIESYHNTQTAWAIVYGAWWFGALQLILGINLFYNIFRYKLIQLKKLPSLIFHASFLFILFGAAVTRYIGFEGTMHIKEGKESSFITTAQNYIQLKNSSTGEMAKEPKYISNSWGNDFDLRLSVAGDEARLRYVDFIPNAVSVYEPSIDGAGEAVLEVVFSNDANKREVKLGLGDSVDLGGIIFSFGDKALNSVATKHYINITLENGEFFIQTSEKIGVLKMSDMSKSELEIAKKVPFENLRLYSLDGLNFAPKTMLANAVLNLKKASDNELGQDAIRASLTYNNESREVILFHNGASEPVSVGGELFEVAWGPMISRLPFSLYLEDFELKRYPGSNSPMSYSSDVIVKPASGDGEFDYKIYMNNVLDFEGFRFFQSSYDMDESGTILSVNSDPGKWPTYIGYFLLSLGLFLNILNPHSRFRKLASAVSEASGDGVKAAILAAVALASFATSDARAAMLVPHIDKEHAYELSTLIIQSADGRMKPFDSLANDVLNKLYRSDNYQGLNANQVLLSMMVNADYWRGVGLIKINDERLKEVLGLAKNAKYASFDDFFDRNESGGLDYKLLKQSELANRMAPGSRGTFEKDVIKADEKLNIIYWIFAGELLRAIPKIDDANNTWHAPSGIVEQFSDPDERIRALGLLERYFDAVSTAQNAKSSGDGADKWAAATAALDEIKAYQKEHGKSVMPSEAQISLELAFNKYKIFERLMPVYLLAGLALLAVVFARMISPKNRLNGAFRVVYWVNVAAFIAHTIGLALRWYIAGHAPWSDSYESLVFIAWSLSLSGMIFARTSTISLALTSILAGVVLMVAHLSWIDPQITTLVPVLQSYWLTIHVSVITASYGFLGLCALLGAFSLVLMAINGDGDKELSKNILEATRINEMAMILGLSLLVVGNFLGGVWANESWGRYWCWDSKETWALVSILVYAAVLHMRFVPKLNDQYAFAVASMWAYSAIIMTYFGVNFYLTGMHSYASGEPVPVPGFVWVGVGVMAALSLAAIRGKKWAKRL